MCAEGQCVHCLTDLVQPVSWLMLFANSGINPFLYALLSERFRAAVTDLLHFKTAREARRRRQVNGDKQWPIYGKEVWRGREYSPHTFLPQSSARVRYNAH
jgi:hypothetical protein